MTENKDIFDEYQDLIFTDIQDLLNLPVQDLVCFTDTIDQSQPHDHDTTIPRTVLDMDIDIPKVIQIEDEVRIDAKKKRDTDRVAVTEHEHNKSASDKKNEQIIMRNYSVMLQNNLCTQSFPAPNTSDILQYKIEKKLIYRNIGVSLEHSFEVDENVNADEETIDEKQKHITSLCKVCGDKAGKHTYYGGTVCGSCRAFFRRSVQSKYFKIFQCKISENCKISSETRKNCQFCR
jgi:hypothetical protein